MPIKFWLLWTLFSIAVTVCSITFKILLHHHQCPWLAVSSRYTSEFYQKIAPDSTFVTQEELDSSNQVVLRFKLLSKALHSKFGQFITIQWRQNVLHFRAGGAGDGRDAHATPVFLRERNKKLPKSALQTRLFSIVHPLKLAPCSGPEIKETSRM